VDHAPRAHDDLAKAVAGALVMLARDITPAAPAALGGDGIWGSTPRAASVPRRSSHPVPVALVGECSIPVV
jgi:hypothetical protein